MKNKETMRRKIVKIYYAIKGFFLEKKMKSGLYYISKYMPDSRFMYVGKRMFYKAIEKVVAPGVVYHDQKSVTYKYWEIGILNFKMS